MSNRIQRGVLALVLLAGLAGTASFAQAQEAATPVSGTPSAAGTPVAAGGVVREVLVESAPATAPGEAFQLVRYTIPAGLSLPPHTHPGIQMNVIESGVLTYYVVAEGEILVNRADGATETFGPGAATTFAEGDAFVEPAGLVHYGANDTTAPVVILTAALIAAGEPPSTLVEAPADELPPGRHHALRPGKRPTRHGAWALPTGLTEWARRHRRRGQPAAPATPSGTIGSGRPPGGAYIAASMNGLTAPPAKDQTARASTARKMTVQSTAKTNMTRPMCVLSQPDPLAKRRD